MLRQYNNFLGLIITSQGLTHEHSKTPIPAVTTLHSDYIVTTPTVTSLHSDY